MKSEAGIPSWLAELLENVQNKASWREGVTQLMLSHMKKKLTEEGHNLFSDLSESERREFMDSIEVLLKQSDPYAVFSKDSSRHIKSVLEGLSLQQVVHGRNRAK